MKYRILPQTSVKISEIGFGCMSLKPDHSHREELLHSAFDHGINYFDTADLYDKGENEELVGKALKSFRKEVVIATKVGNEWLPDGSSWRWNPSKAYILKAVDGSLQRLQTDYIDLYQLHGGTVDDSMEEVLDAFETVQKAGKIRYYGVSSIRPNVIMPYAAHQGMASTMLQYSLLDRRPEEHILDHLQEHQVGVMVRGALAKGRLAGKPVEGYQNHSSEEVQHLLEVLSQLSTPKRSIGQLALRYVLNHSAVTSAIVGIRTPQQLQEAVGASGVNVTEDEVVMLSESIEAHLYMDHR